MQEADREILIMRALEKSDEAIQTARLNLDNNLLSASQNRIYYGIYLKYINTTLKTDKKLITTLFINLLKKIWKYLTGMHCILSNA